MDNIVYDQSDIKIDNEIDHQNDDHRKNDETADQIIYQFPNIVCYNCSSRVE